MKLRYLKFFIIALLSIFLIVFPALSQSTAYTATVNRFNGSQVGQTIRASTPNQLAERIYPVIRPGNLLPEINISLGTVTLNTFQSTIRSKGLSAEYYEFIQGGTSSKTPWNSINVSSVSSSSATYGVVLWKNGYSNPGHIPFRVTGMQGGSPALRFDRSSVTLQDGRNIDFTVEVGNSGINSTWLGQYLKSKDSRLSLRVLSDFDIQRMQICRNNPMIQEECPTPPNYLIRLSRG